MKTGKRKDLGPDGLYGFLKSILPKSKFTISDLTNLLNSELRRNGLSPISRQSAFNLVTKMRKEGLVEIVGVSKKPRSFIVKSSARVGIGNPDLGLVSTAPPNVTKLMAEVGDEIEAKTAVAKTTVISRKIAERITELNKMKSDLDQLLAGDVLSETRAKFGQLKSEIEALAESAGALICFDCKKKREQMITDRVMLVNASDRLKAREARFAADALRGGPASVIHSK